MHRKEHYDDKVLNSNAMAKRRCIIPFEAVWLTMLIINIVDGAGLTFIHVSSILSNRKGEME